MMTAAPARTHPRKTPRQRRSAAVVEAIYEASARILEESGMAALNTNIAAERAGVSVGSLYQYFPSKEAIVAGLLRRARTTLLERIKAVTACHASLTLEEALSRLIAAGVRHQLERPALARALEYAETVLPADQETALLKREIARQVSAMLEARGLNNAACLAQDITALARGMIDAAGLAGETGATALERRVTAAVFGYLERMRSDWGEPPCVTAKPAH